MKSPMLAAVLLLPLALGCGATATVTGKVEYAGMPAERGKVRFLPLDANGELDGKVPIVGSEVVNGSYTTKGVPFGKKKVAVAVESADGQTITEQQPADINSANQTVDISIDKLQK